MSQNIFTYAINEQFTNEDITKVSLSVVVNNWLTLAVDYPAHARLSLFKDKDLKSESPYTKTDFLVVTHIDSDHINWFANLVWSKFFWENKKLKLIAHPRVKNILWKMFVYEMWQSRTTDIRSPMKFEDYIDYIPLKYGETALLPWFGSIKAFSRSAKHSPNMDVLAFKVYDEQWKNIWNFSWDTKFDPKLIDFLACDWWPIIHEAGAYVSEWSHSHTSIKELIQNTSSEVQSNLFINHIPESKEAEIRDEIKKSWSPIRLADEFYPEYLREARIKANQILGMHEVVFPWSFDPFTYWHISSLREYLESHPYSNVTILVGVHPEKKTTFSWEERKFLIEKSLPSDIAKRVKVITYKWVVANYLFENNLKTVIKWARDEKDFLYEQGIAEASNRFSTKITTIIIPQTDKSLSNISSSGLKMLHTYWWDIRDFANPLTREALTMKNTWKFLTWVTGSIGSWKSTLCKKLEEFSKDKEIPIHYINLDYIWHQIHTRTDLPLFQEVRNRIADKFWYWVLEMDWTTNRKKLWQLVFSNKKLLDELMDIMLTPMLYLLSQEIQSKPKWIILVEWAVIVERKLTHLFDENLVDISISRKLQYERVAERDKMSLDQIKRRMSTQLSNEWRAEIISMKQTWHYDRLNMKIRWDRYNIEEIYSNFVKEYKKRENIIR